jgi:hypothetical protein
VTQISSSTARTPASQTVFVDSFADDSRPGQVVGRAGSNGILRGGVDVENVISIDNGALRFRPLVRSGWGRSQVAYGPHQRRAGLLMAALVLNGHNTSQGEPLSERFVKRMVRWLQGHGDRRLGLLRRAGQWLSHPRKAYMVRRLRWWCHLAGGSVERIDENLAVGWAAPGQEDPLDGGNQFVMHAALGDNGELWIRSANRLLPVVRRVKDLPICYAVLARERGAAYYVGSLPGAHGMGGLPDLRPVGIDAFCVDPVLHAAVHQAALGQIGFRVDTRVYGVQVADVPAFAAWYGTAHAADGLRGHGSLDRAEAQVGGRWSIVEGGFERRSSGTVSLAHVGVAVLSPGAPSGLVHVTAERPLSEEGTIGLVWRFQDAGNHLFVEIGLRECRMVRFRDGTPSVLAAAGGASLPEDGPVSIQVVDDGATVVVAANGCSVFGDAIAIRELSEADGVGIRVTDGAGVHLHDFEAHPRRVDLGRVLELPHPWFVTATEPVVADDLAGSAGADLDRRSTPDGLRTWQRQYGKGRIVTDGGSGARVVASIDRPNPGNTAYTIDWDAGEVADLSVVITPPGTSRGEGHRSRAGLIFWQDDKNFVTVSTWLEDYYDGASVAIFPHLDGFEELYDAVWTMVSEKVYWGVPYRLRVVFDGMRLLVFVDDEPVLYRALTDFYPERGPMHVCRVGLAVNWEWGDDTGSRFASFSARRASADQPSIEAALR